MTGDRGPCDADQNARLVAFFEARLDEEETAANAATKGPWLIDEGDETPDHSLTIKGGPDQIPDVPGRETVVYSPYIWAETWPDFAHIARHDPTRVLAEIRIKRYLISEYRSVETFDEHAAVQAAMRLPDEQAAMTALGQAWAKEAARSLLLAVIKAEASLYALHPDYEPAWSLWPHVREHGVPR